MAAGKAYPWGKCIKDHGGGTKAKKICGSIRAKSMKAHGGKTLTKRRYRGGK